MERKYQYYIIQINYHNGDTERLNTVKANSDINASSYKEMLKVYSEVKELYKDKECNIDFCGVGKDGAMGILFTKECKIHKEKEKIKDFDYVIDLLEEAKLAYEQREKYMKNNQGLIDKKIDTFLHEIELANDKYTDEDKIKVFDNIKGLRIQRRDLKNEGSLFDIIKSNFVMGSIKKILISSEKARHRQERKQKRIEEGDKTVLKNLEVHEFNYKDFKDRMRIMQEIQKQFTKITYDEKEKKIYAYNKCYK